MKKVLFAISFVFLLILCSCTEFEELPNVKIADIQYYDVKIEIDFIPNLIFSKYNVLLKIDDKNKATLNHGEDWNNSLKLEKGVHTIKFIDSEDYSISNSVFLDVGSDLEVKYQISCHSSKISVEELYIDRDVELSNGEIKILKSNSEYINKNFNDVEEEFRNMGFRDIKTDALYDIFFGITKEESVEKVTINGKDDYKRGEIYTTDDEVIITYHLSYEKDPERQTTIKTTTILTTKTPTNSNITTTSTETKVNNALVEEEIRSKIIGKSYVFARNTLQEMGYSSTYEHEYTHMDFTGTLKDYYTDEEIEEMGFIITGIKKINVEKKAIDLYINTEENIKRIEDQKTVQEKLEEYLDPSTALAAMEVYGKEQYPYGFSIKMMTGRIAETAVDEKTWFMKYEATVKNEFKKKIDVTCEAKITGPPDNPTVYDFIVY